VRLVAIRTGAVSQWRRRELLHVAALAALGQATGVGLVAASTSRVPDPRLATLLRMARVAGPGEHRRLVRQAAVAAAAGDVSRARRRQRHLFLMAAFTQAVLGEVELEMVRGMAVLAGHATVEGALARGGLMATTARARQRLGLLPAGVRVVASQASASVDALGVVAVHVPVTLRAGCARRTADVVRGVAARADRVRRYFGLGEYDHVGVARAAGNGLLGLKLVRAMATHALRVPAGEKRRSRHDGLRLAVALATSAERVRSRRVLVSVARGAHAIGRFSVRGMLGVDVFVAAGTGGRHWRAVLMRAMTAQALTRGVHDHRRRVPLIFQVTTGAIFRAEWLEHTAVELIVHAAVTRERMAHHAVGFGAVTEACLRFRRSVLDAGLVRVTSDAPARRHGPNRRAVECVATIAGDALLHDVDLMTGSPTVRAPFRLHIQSFSRGTGAPTLTGRARRTGPKHSQQECRQQEEELESSRSQHCSPHSKSLATKVMRLSAP